MPAKSVVFIVPQQNLQPNEADTGLVRLGKLRPIVEPAGIRAVLMSPSFPVPVESHSDENESCQSSSGER